MPNDKKASMNFLDGLNASSWGLASAGPSSMFFSCRYKDFGLLECVCTSCSIRSMSLSRLHTVVRLSTSIMYAVSCLILRTKGNACFRHSTDSYQLQSGETTFQRFWIVPLHYVLCRPNLILEASIRIPGTCRLHGELCRLPMIVLCSGASMDPWGNDLNVVESLFLSKPARPGLGRPQSWL